MPKYRVNFEASAAIGVEIEVEAETPEAAQAEAQKLWDAKDVTGRLSSLIDVDDFAREGFAEAIGLTIPYATVSPDENGFEIVDVFTPDMVQDAPIIPSTRATAQPLTSQERNTILAALRYYQQQGQSDPANRSDEIHDIATNGDADISMDADGIDELCMKLNR